MCRWNSRNSGVRALSHVSRSRTNRTQPPNIKNLQLLLNKDKINMKWTTIKPWHVLYLHSYKNITVKETNFNSQNMPVFECQHLSQTVWLLLLPNHYELKKLNIITHVQFSMKTPYIFYREPTLYDITCSGIAVRRRPDTRAYCGVLAVPRESK